MDIHRRFYIMYILILKELKGKYANSHLGFLWHILTPMIQVILYYIVFGSILYQGDSRYWLYLSAGVFPFIFFQSCLSSGSISIISNSELVKKVHFPREIIVLANVFSYAIIFIFGYVVVISLMIIFGEPIGINILLLMPTIGLTVLFALGYTLVLSCITVYFRDMQHIIDAFSRVFFWVTPIFYYTSSLDGILSKIIWINPYTYFIELYHNIVFYSKIPSVSLWLCCISISIFTFIVGWLLFSMFKNKFAEVI